MASRPRSMNMASLLDRGDNYHVIYLGSCMLTQLATGLGAIQKPLRDLYFRYRQAGGGPAAHDRSLQVSDKGLTMTYRDGAAASSTQIFYDMINIVSWEAVQFVSVKASKRIMGAFEPIDCNHSRNKDNLFAPVDKKYLFLQQMTHPPMFCCVLRRPTGVRALDVHAFVCSSQEESLGLVKALAKLQTLSQADDAQETGVFGYRPFDAPNTENTGSFHRDRVSRSTVGEPDPASVIKHSTAERQKTLNTYHLSQTDFDVSQVHDQSDLQQLGRPANQSDGDHVYQLVGQARSPPLPRSSRQTADNKSSPSPTSPCDITRPLATEAAKQARQRPQNESRRGLDDKPSKSRIESSPTSNVGLSQKEINQRSKSPSKFNKLGQGYSLLSGSGSSLPGQVDRDYRPSSNQEHSPQLPPRSPLRVPSSGFSDRTQEYDNLPRPRSSHIPSYSAEHSEYFDDYHDDKYDQRHWSSGVLRQRADRQQDPNGSFEERSRNVTPQREQSIHQLDREQRPPTPLSRTRDVPSRPIAMVTPHKITGIKVLPSNRDTEKKTRNNINETPRPKSAVFDDLEYTKPPPSSKSYFSNHQKVSKPSSLPKTQKQSHESNWRLKTNESINAENFNNEMDRTDSSVNEKLLMNQKKDAEIASVMQNLRFGFDSSTVTPGVPAGQNFEKSLGYFP